MTVFSFSLIECQNWCVLNFERKVILDRMTPTQILKNLVLLSGWSNLIEKWIGKVWKDDTRTEMVWTSGRGLLMTVGDEPNRPPPSPPRFAPRLVATTVTPYYSRILNSLGPFKNMPFCCIVEMHIDLTEKKEIPCIPDTWFGLKISFRDRLTNSHVNGKSSVRFAYCYGYWYVCLEN